MICRRWKLGRCLSSFNGAAPIQERNDREPHRARRDLDNASMEPLPFRSGMQDEPSACTRSANGASMEPLPFRSGMAQSDEAGFIPSTNASMEPLPFRSGMLSPLEAVAPTADELQWSRSHSGAEWLV